MKLLVGLGNPGTEYEKTRHNIGFMAVDAIAHRHNFLAPKLKFRSEIREGVIAGHKLLIQKPLTFMNLSGAAVQELCRFYKILPSDVIVFHDDLDLAFGKVKIKQGGGNGGHNGLKSLDSHVGNAYWRIRLGIGHPGEKAKVTGYVLGAFSLEERSSADSWLCHIADTFPLFLTKGEQGFLNQLAIALRPIPPSP